MPFVWMKPGVFDAPRVLFADPMLILWDGRQVPAADIRSINEGQTGDWYLNGTKNNPNLIH